MNKNDQVFDLREEEVNRHKVLKINHWGFLPGGFYFSRRNWHNNCVKGECEEKWEGDNEKSENIGSG